MTNDLTIPTQIENEVELLPGFTRNDVIDWRTSIDPSNRLTWSQIKVFLQHCIATRLDPRRKHIYAIPRHNSSTGRTELTTVTSIDGFRLVAERTGKYAPGRPTEYLRNSDGKLIGATVYVKKMTNDGTWHEVSESAFLCEYMPQRPSNFWRNMPSVMIAKVAEARALRRAFPDTFSGIYGEDELDQAHTETNSIESTSAETVVEPTISEDEFLKLDRYLNSHEELRNKIKMLCKVNDLRDIKQSQKNAVNNYARAYMQREEAA